MVSECSNGLDLRTHGAVLQSTKPTHDAGNGLFGGVSKYDWPGENALEGRYEGGL